MALLLASLLSSKRLSVKQEAEAVKQEAGATEADPGNDEAGDCLKEDLGVADYYTEEAWWDGDASDAKQELDATGETNDHHPSW